MNKTYINFKESLNNTNKYQKITIGIGYSMILILIPFINIHGFEDIILFTQLIVLILTNVWFYILGDNPFFVKIFKIYNESNNNIIRKYHSWIPIPKILNKDKLFEENYYEVDFLPLFLQKSVPYKNGKINGDLKVFFTGFDQLLIKYNIPYKDSLIHGIGKRYYRSGNVLCEVKFTNGLKTFEKYYHESGELKGEIPIINGLRHGICKGYLKNGETLEELLFESGRIISKKTNNTSGELIEELEFTGEFNDDGRKEHIAFLGRGGDDELFLIIGKVRSHKIYYTGKRIKYECIYKQNFSEKIERVYYESGQLKMEMYYEFCGIYQKKVKRELYKNGNTRSETIYKWNGPDWFSTIIISPGDFINIWEERSTELIFTFENYEIQETVYDMTGKIINDDNT